MSDGAPSVVLCRWRPAAGAKAALVEAWAAVARGLFGRGARGSILRWLDHGLRYGDARWPSLAPQDASHAGVMAAGFTAVATAIEEACAEAVLAPVADLLHPLRLTPDRRPR